MCYLGIFKLLFMYLLIFDTICYWNILFSHSKASDANIGIFCKFCLVCEKDFMNFEICSMLHMIRNTNTNVKIFQTKINL